MVAGTFVTESNRRDEGYGRGRWAIADGRRAAVAPPAPPRRWEDGAIVGAAARLRLTPGFRAEIRPERQKLP